MWFHMTQVAARFTTDIWTVTMTIRKVRPGEGVLRGADRDRRTGDTTVTVGEVPTNPLSRRDDSDPEMEERRHHRHHHRHHHHHRHGSSRSSSRSRSRSHHHQTEADKKERWGHELYIEKVILNPEPEPPRIITEIEAPQEKWISKAVVLLSLRTVPQAHHRIRGVGIISVQYCVFVR